MVKETEVIEETVEREVTVYKCDKCHGRNHEDEIEERDRLNRVLFGAEAWGNYSMNVQNGHDIYVGNNSWDEPTLHGEYEYLLCDECMERAYDYLKDFF